MKLNFDLTFTTLFASLPVRERGLKQNLPYKIIGIGQSLPVRERGLKREKKEGDEENGLVAPCTGAWIETMNMRNVMKNI